MFYMDNKTIGLVKNRKFCVVDASFEYVV